jgi:proteasome lid subunit RPN8/RPN11
VVAGVGAPAPSPQLVEADQIASAAMKLTSGQARELIAHARDDAPNECCGMVGGNDGVASTVYRARNAEASPFRYNLDPEDLYRILHREMEDKGEELLAIYHSHTKSPAYPSETDRNLVSYPDAIYLIISLLEGEEPIRGFRMQDGEVEEVEIEIGG